MVIGKSLKPRVLKEKLRKELGSDYHTNEMARIARFFLFDWLKRLELFVGMENARKCLLPLENCIAVGRRRANYAKITI